MTKVKTPEGKFIYYSYDGYGRQLTRKTPDAGEADFTYDKNNNLIFSQDEVQRVLINNSTRYTFRNYDGLNRLTGIGEVLYAVDNPSTIQYQSDSAGNYLTVNVYDTITKSIVINLFSVPSDYYSTTNFTKGNLVSTAYRTRKSDSWNFKYYRYDVRGRVIKLWNIISGFDTLVTEYQYNS